MVEEQRGSKIGRSRGFSEKMASTSWRGGRKKTGQLERTLEAGCREKKEEGSR